MGREIAVTEFIFALSIVVVTSGESLIVDGIDIGLLVMPQSIAKLTNIPCVGILEALLEALLIQMGHKTEIRTRKPYYNCYTAEAKKLII